MGVKASNYVCCTIDVTMAARIIAFIGIGLSFVLMTVLLNDKLSTHDDYDVSRKTALALGLDWSHFHENISTHPDSDPEGIMIQIIMIFYALAFLVLNLVLFFGSIKMNWICALPWLVFELLGCLSKFGALTYHLRCAPNHMSQFFIVGSLIYIVVMFWWWLVVFTAARIWKSTMILDFVADFESVSLESPIKHHVFKYPFEN